jgi:hypothetical protein
MQKRALAQAEAERIHNLIGRLNTTIKRAARLGVQTHIDVAVERPNQLPVVSVRTGITQPADERPSDRSGSIRQ